MESSPELLPPPAALEGGLLSVLSSR
jgi:hypothetical protein